MKIFDSVGAGVPQLPRPVKAPIVGALYAYDTETFLISPGLLAPPLVCGSIADERPGSENLLDADEARAWFRLALERGVDIVGANLAYDLGVMAADDPSLLDGIFAAADAGRLHDVAIREALIDIAKGTHGVDPQTGRPLGDDEGARYPLALLVQRHLGLDISDEKKSPDAWRLRYGELAHVPLAEWPQAAIDYPKRDARFTIDVYLKQEELAKSVPNGGNLHAEAEQVRAAFALHLASTWGIRTDAGRVGALRREIEVEYAALQEKFRAVGVLRPDGTKDMKRLRELVTEAFAGNPPYTKPGARYPNGQIATDRDTLEGSGDEHLAELGGSGKVAKYRSTYIGKLEEGVAVPINPRFNVLVSTTRVSSDYQQLPQKGGIRECHEARPGFIYCSVDYGGLELRTMSQRAIWEPLVGYSKMADALNAHLDPHVIAAAEFLGRPYADVLAAYDARDALATDFRSLGKLMNFGAGGGMVGGTLAYQARAKDKVSFCLLSKRAERCGVEREPIKVQGKVKMICRMCATVARELHAKWLAAWPEQKALQGIAKGETYGGRMVDVMIPGANILRGSCGYTQFLNTPFQGLGAVGTKLAMWRISREMHTDRRSPLFGSHLNLNVHDELIAELATGTRERLVEMPQRTHDAAERMAEIMRQAMRETTPDLAPAIEAEPALSYTLSKGMKTLRSPAGRLLAWAPEEKRAA